VRSVAREILAAQIARRQQKHDSFVKKGHADALLIIEVVDVLLELCFIGVSLRYEGYNSLTFKLVDVFEVGAKGHIEIVKTIWEILLVVLPHDRVSHHTDAELLIARHEPTPNALLIIVEEVDRLGTDHIISCALSVAVQGRCQALRAFLLIGRFLLFFDKVNNTKTRMRVLIVVSVSDVTSAGCCRAKTDLLDRGGLSDGVLFVEKGAKLALKARRGPHGTTALREGRHARWHWRALHARVRMLGARHHASCSCCRCCVREV